MIRGMRSPCLALRQSRVSHRRRVLCAGFAVVVVAGALTGCAQLGGPRTHVITEAELARQIEKRFPYDSRVLDLLDVQVSAPRVRLLPDSNRVAISLTLTGSDRLIGHRWHGEIALDHGLRYDAAEQAVRLTDVRVQRLVLDELPASLRSGLDRWGGRLAEQLLSDAVIYRFRPEDLRTAQGLGYVPGAVAVTPRGIEITLLPAAR